MLKSPQGAWPFPTGNKPEPQPERARLTFPEVLEISNSELLNELGLKVCHINNHKYGHSFTVLYRRVVSNGTFYDIAVAVCSPKDQYSRKRGVDLALDNYCQGNTLRVPLGVSPDTALRAMFDPVSYVG